MAKRALLEFDRHRKSMSVICGPAEGAALAESGSNSNSTANGPVTRRSARAASQGPEGSNALLVKGAAECVLARCSKVRRQVVVRVTLRRELILNSAK